MAKVVDEWKLRRNKTIAEENVERSRYHDALEWQCRFAARFLQQEESDWENLVPLLVAIEEGRLYSLDAYTMTSEESAAWRDYMSNR